MIDPSLVSAVLVTRGDVDLAPILASLHSVFGDRVHVYDNSREPDLKVYGRYRAAQELSWLDTGDVFYTQDDDCTVPLAELLAAYDGQELLVNVPAGEKPWLAWGAVFRRWGPQRAFECYRRRLGLPEGSLIPDEMLRWPDVIFASLTPWESVDVGHQDLPHAFAANRMYRQHDHYESQQLVEQRCLELGGTVRRA